MLCIIPPTNLVGGACAAAQDLFRPQSIVKPLTCVPASAVLAWLGVNGKLKQVK